MKDLRFIKELFERFNEDLLVYVSIIFLAMFLFGNGCQFKFEHTITHVNKTENKP
jgi:hypothetical protein